MKNYAIADKFRDEGNAFYRQIKFYEALISYNKSLCNAIPQSSQLGLAYANRSAVYFELKQFDKCLENIQLARDNKYPHECKLKERESKCQEEQKTHQPDPKNDPWTHFKLSYPANEKIPTIVDCLELKEDEKYGRYIVTNQNLNPGDVIAIEEPIFRLLDKRAWFSRCTFCLKSNMLNLIPCSYKNDETVCSSAMYCDEECLIKARYRFHDAFCRPRDLLCSRMDAGTIDLWASVAKGLLESLAIVERPETLRSLMSSNKQKTIFDYDSRNKQDDPNSDFESLLIFNNLEMDSDEAAEAHYKQFASLFVRTYPQLKALSNDNPEMESLLVEYATRFAMIRNRNSISFADQGADAGSVVLPFASLYSHSCDQNTHIFCIDNKFVHIALKPIKKGEQLFINYGFHFGAHPARVERQEALMKDYKFKCSCVACLTDYSVSSLPRYDPNFELSAVKLPDTIDEMIAELRERFKYIKDNFQNYPSLEVFDSILRCDKLLTSIKDKSMWSFSNA